MAVINEAYVKPKGNLEKLKWARALQLPCARTCVNESSKGEDATLEL